MCFKVRHAIIMLELVLLKVAHSSKREQTCSKKNQSLFFYSNSCLNLTKCFGHRSIFVPVKKVLVWFKACGLNENTFGHAEGPGIKLRFYYSPQSETPCPMARGQEEDQSCSNPLRNWA